MGGIAELLAVVTPLEDVLKSAIHMQHDQSMARSPTFAVLMVTFTPIFVPL